MAHPPSAHLVALVVGVAFQVLGCLRRCLPLLLQRFHWKGIISRILEHVIQIVITEAAFRVHECLGRGMVLLLVYAVHFRAEPGMHLHLLLVVLKHVYSLLVALQIFVSNLPPFVKMLELHPPLVRWLRHRTIGLCLTIYLDCSGHCGHLDHA